jgi:hypothetical protein
LEVGAAPLAAVSEYSIDHDRRNAAYTKMLCALRHLVIPHIVDGHFAGWTGGAADEHNRLFAAGAASDEYFDPSFSSFRCFCYVSRSC